ncbi:MAG: SoxR reducing system RseC family protein [Nitrospirae bacterium]|nr:SoxR reducing system RseC family protein [Nitrospirota bacterium]
MEEIGIVTKTEGLTAKVAVQKKGGCEGCGAKGVCETTEAGMEIEALNPVNAKEGQTVKVSIKPSVYLKGTMLVYGFPLIAMFAGAISGKNIGETYMKETSSDLIAAIAGFSALIVSFLGVKLWSHKMETKPEYKPVIEEIIK